MAGPDTLATLNRLRRLQVLMARREMAERLGQLQSAEAASAAATARLDTEAAAAASRPTDYLAWLPRGLAQRDERAAEMTPRTWDFLLNSAFTL